MQLVLLPVDHSLFEHRKRVRCSGSFDVSVMGEPELEPFISATKPNSATPVGWYESLRPCIKTSSSVVVNTQMKSLDPSDPDAGALLFASTDRELKCDMMLRGVKINAFSSKKSDDPYSRNMHNNQSQPPPPPPQQQQQQMKKKKPGSLKKLAKNNAVILGGPMMPVISLQYHVEGYRKYFVSNWEAFFRNIYGKYLPESRCFYENLYLENPCRFYADIEFPLDQLKSLLEGDNLDQLDQKQLVDWCWRKVDKLIAFISETISTIGSNIYEDNQSRPMFVSKVFTSDATNPKKFSCHLVFHIGVAQVRVIKKWNASENRWYCASFNHPGYKTITPLYDGPLQGDVVRFSTNRSLQQFSLLLLAKADNDYSVGGFKENPMRWPDSSCILDQSVYGNTVREFRLVGSTKTGDFRPLLPRAEYTFQRNTREYQYIIFKKTVDFLSANLFEDYGSLPSLLPRELIKIIIQLMFQWKLEKLELYDTIASHSSENTFLENEEQYTSAAHNRASIKSIALCKITDTSPIRSYLADGGLSLEKYYEHGTHSAGHDAFCNRMPRKTSTTFSRCNICPLHRNSCDMVESNLPVDIDLHVIGRARPVQDGFALLNPEQDYMWGPGIFTDTLASYCEYERRYILLDLQTPSIISPSSPASTTSCIKLQAHVTAPNSKHNPYWSIFHRSDSTSADGDDELDKTTEAGALFCKEEATTKKAPPPLAVSPDFLESLDHFLEEHGFKTGNYYIH